MFLPVMCLFVSEDYLKKKHIGPTRMRMYFDSG